MEGLCCQCVAYSGGDPHVIILNGERIMRDLQVCHWADLLASPGGLRRAGARRSRQPPFTINTPTVPLNLTTSFGHILQYAGGNWMDLSKTSLTDAQIVDCFETAGRVAVATILNALSRTQRDEWGIADCDALPLMRLAYGTELIGELAVPDLLRQAADGQWEPDISARRWVRSTVGLARTHRQPVDACDSDPETMTLALFVMTLPLSVLESTALCAALTPNAGVDAGFGAVSAAQRYPLAREDLRRSLGMSNTNRPLAAMSRIWEPCFRPASGR